MFLSTKVFEDLFASLFGKDIEKIRILFYRMSMEIMLSTSVHLQGLHVLAEEIFPIMLRRRISLIREAAT